MNDYQIYVASGIIIKNKKMLAGRSRGRPHFIIPGGKLQPQETPKSAVAREIKEEFGIEIKPTDLHLYKTVYEDAALGDFNKGKIVRADVFMVKAWEGEPRATSEIDEMAWINSKDLNTIELGGILKNHIIPSLKKENLLD